MNPRERILAIVILSLVVVAGLGVLAYQFLLVPLEERDASLVAMRTDIEKKQTRVAEIMADRPKLERWRQLSLPPDVNVAQLEYDKFLSNLARDSGFSGVSFIITPRPVDDKTAKVPSKKDPIYKRLTYEVQARGELAAIVDFLERFYRTGLLHEIKKIQIQRQSTATATTQQPANELVMNLTIEALSLAGVPARKSLLPTISTRLAALDVVTVLQGGPAGIALVPWAVGPTGPLGPQLLADPPREYAAVAGKDIFFGPPNATPQQRADFVDVTQFVYLTHIYRVKEKAEAWLYDRYKNKPTRLRESAGFNSFRVVDTQGETQVIGRIVRLDDRDVIFRANDRYYALHIGDSLGDALKRPLKQDELVNLGLVKGPTPKEKTTEEK